MGVIYNNNVLRKNRINWPSLVCRALAKKED